MMMEPGQSKNSVEEVELEEIGKRDSNKASGEEIPEEKDKEPEVEQTSV